MIEGIKNEFKGKNASKWLELFSFESLEEVFLFHKSLPSYEATPLQALNNLAEKFKIDKLYVKDESQRFGLKAFKGLGASYAIGQYYADRLQQDLKDLSFKQLVEKTKSLPPVTFTTATDGNHGKSVAWAAQLFDQPAVVYMPKGTAEARLEAVRAYGAKAIETSHNYDDTVKKVAQIAQEKNWELIQDTAWEGYEKIPLAIMQGYSTIIEEIEQELGKEQFCEISHIILQAGVGSFAASVVAAIINRFQELGENHLPQFLIVEPAKADPLYRSAVTEKGEVQRVYGDLDTIMAGLACGEPSPIAWDILKAYSDYFFTCHDDLSKRGIYHLATPVGNDPKIIAGESGAISLGFLHHLMTTPDLASWQEKMDFGSDAQVLVINTEGDTDPEHYLKILDEMTQTNRI